MASKRHQRRRSCENKKAYPTSAEAAQAARGLGGGWWVYCCDFHDHWHVGCPSRRRRQAIAAARRARREA